MHFQDISCVIYVTFSLLYLEVGLPFSQARDSMLMLLQSNTPMSIWTEEGEICCKFELLSLKVHQSTWSTFVRELCYYKPRQTCLISRAQAKTVWILSEIISNQWNWHLFCILLQDLISALLWWRVTHVKRTHVVLERWQRGWDGGAILARGASDNNVKRPVFIRVQRLDQSLIKFRPRPILTHCSDSMSSVYIVGSCGER